MDKYQVFFQERLKAVALKQALVAEKAQEKRDYLDPTWKFNVEASDIIDADTVHSPKVGDRTKKDELRLRGWDSYETSPDPYLKNPNKFKTHQRSYAAAYGLKPEDVSMNDLLEAGKAQKQRFKQKLLNVADAEGNISYKRRGLDKFNRVLTEIIPEGKQAAFVQDVTSRFEDAGYSGKFNFMRELQDFESGDTAAHLTGSGDRGWGQAATDSIANTVRGALQIANDLGQSASVLTGVNNIPSVDKFFENNRDRLESFKEFFNSPQQLRRERLAGEKRSRIAEPLFEVRKKEYMEEGSSEGEAKFKAGLFEAADTIVDLIEQPGRILDGFFESLPYMLGVGAGGKIVLTAAEKALQKSTLEVVTRAAVKRGSTETAEVLAAEAKNAVQKYISTDAGTAFMKKVSERTGVALVGLTEGLTNAADTYSSILSMTEEEGQNSQNYLDLRSRGLSHEEAVKRLAAEGFRGTLGLMTFIAGAISKVTGAAGFESRIFSRLADSKKALAVPGIAAKAAGLSKAILDPSLRETVEESVQSGAGEFLTQLAQFNATGKPIGAGIGAATAEGGVLGFASGGGIAAISKGGKAALGGAGKAFLKLTDTQGTGKGLDEAAKTNVASLFKIEAANDPTNPEDGIYPGGSQKIALDKVKAAQEAGTYDSVAAYNASLESYKTSGEEGSIEGTIQHFNELEVHFKQQEYAGKVTTEVEQDFETLKERYESTINEAAKAFLSQQDRTEYDPRIKAIITEAAYRKLSAATTVDTTNLNTKTKKVLSNVADINTTLDDLTKNSAEATLVESEATDSPDNIQGKTSEEVATHQQKVVNNLVRVNAAKLDDVVSTIQVRGKTVVVQGIKAHVREMLELVSRGDEESKKAFIAKQKEVSNLVATQRVRSQGLLKLLSAVLAGKSEQEIKAIEKQTKFYYIKAKEFTESPTVKLYEYMQEELANIQKAQSQMAGLYQTWNGYDSSINKIQKAKVNVGKTLPVQQELALTGGKATAPKTTTTAKTSPAPETAEQPGKPQAQPEVAEAGEGAANTKIITSKDNSIAVKTTVPEGASKELTTKLRKLDESDTTSLNSRNPDYYPTGFGVRVGDKYDEGLNVVATFVMHKSATTQDTYDVVTKVTKPAQQKDGVQTKAAGVEVTMFGSKKDADDAIQKRLTEIRKRIGSRQKKAIDANSKKVTSNVAADRASQDAEADAAASQEAEADTTILEISKLPLQERIPALIVAGIIEEVYQYGVRPIVVVKINGQSLPFYRSSSGTSGKEKGRWFPMFGFGKQSAKSDELNWLIKGTKEGVNTNYKSENINEYSNIINSLLNWEHKLDLNIGFGNENPFFTPHITFKTDEEGFNKKIFGKKDLEVVFDTTSVSTHINSIIAKIDGKNPALPIAKGKVAVTDTYQKFAKDTRNEDIEYIPAVYGNKDTYQVKASILKSLPGQTYHQLLVIAEKQREESKKYANSAEGTKSRRIYNNIIEEAETAERYAKEMNDYSGGVLENTEPPAPKVRETPAEEAAQIKAAVDAGQISSLFSTETLHWAHSQFGPNKLNDITNIPVLFGAAVIIGTEAIYQGAKDFAEFTARMLEELGEFWQKLNKDDQQDIYRLSGEQANSLLDNEGDPLQLRNNIDPNLPENTTNGFKVFGNVRTNSEQDKAIVRILDFFKDKDVDNKYFTLVGRGGTGKTTIIGKAIDLLKEDNETLSVTFYAPKNKAANVLRRATGEVVYTLSQGLAKVPVNVRGNYEFLQSEAKLKKIRDKISGTATKTQDGGVMLGKHLIIIDEASQISEDELIAIDKLVRENPDLNTKVIFMGDNAQLPPIRPAGSKYIGQDSEVFTKIKAVLKFRMRQGKDSPIPALTDVVADNALSELPKQQALKEQHRVSNVNAEKNSGVVFTNPFAGMWTAWKKDYLANPEYTRLLTYNSNDSKAKTKDGKDMPWGVKLLNEEARITLFGKGSEFLNEKESIVLNKPVKVRNLETDKNQLLPTSSELIVTQILTPVSGKDTKKIKGRVEYQEVDIENEEEVVFIDRSFTIRGEVEVVSVIAEIEGEKFAFNIPTPKGEIQLAAELKAAPWQERAAMQAHFAKYQYGYAINSHIAQGSTYRNVYVFEDNILNRLHAHEGTLEALYKEQNQALYVAMSRPSHKLVMVSQGNFTDNQESMNFDSQESNNPRPIPVLGEDQEDFTVLTNEELEESLNNLQIVRQDNENEIANFIRQTGQFKLTWLGNKWPDVKYRIHDFQDGTFRRQNTSKPPKIFNIKPKEAIDTNDPASMTVGEMMLELSAKYNFNASEIKRAEREIEKRQDPNYVPNIPDPNVDPEIESTAQEVIVYPAAQARLDAIQELKSRIAEYQEKEKALELKNAEDNAVLQERIEAGFPAEQVLTQLENAAKQEVADQGELVVEQARYPEIADAAKNVISNINKDKSSPTVTKETLEKIVDLRELADEQPDLFAGIEGVKTEDFDPFNNTPSKAWWTETAERRDAKNRDDKKAVERLLYEYKEQHAETVKKRVLAALEAKNKPLTGKDFLRQKSSKSKSLFNTVRGVIYSLTAVDANGRTDPVARKQLYKAMNATDEQEEGFNRYLQYHQDFSKVFQDIYADFNRHLEQGTFKASGKYLFTDPRLIEYGMQWLFNNKGKLAIDILAMMSMESFNWLGTSGPATTMNRDEIIKRILGFPPSYELTSLERNRFLHIGTSRLEVGLRLGQAVWKHINLRLEKGSEIDNHQEQKIIASLGSMMLGVMHEMKSIEGESLTMAEFNSYANQEAEAESEVTGDDEGNVVFIKNTPPSNAEKDLGLNHPINEELKLAYEQAKDLFAKYFGSTPTTRDLVFKEPTADDVNTEVSRGMMQVPKELLKRILYMTQQKLQVSTRMMDEVLSRYSDDDFLSDIEDQVSQTEIDEWTHVQDRKGIRASNLMNRKSLEALKNFYAKNGSRIFYTLYKVIISGRIYTDSNSLDIQNNKMHRFLVHMKEWMNEVNPADTTSKEHFTFMVAVGLGFGVDPSLFTEEKTHFNLERNTLEQEVNKKLTNKDVQAALAILRQKSDKKFSDEERASIKAAVKYLGENTHSLVALKEYAEYLNAQAEGRTFTSYLPTEVDGKTNGLAALLLQFVPNSVAGITQSKQMLKGTGTYFQEDLFKNNPEYIAQGGRDNYEGLSIGVGTNLQNMLNGNIPELTNPRKYGPDNTDGHRREDIRKTGVGAVMASGLLLSIREFMLEDTEAGEEKGKKGRKSAKPTLLRVGYLAMMASIKRGQIADALDAFRKGLSQIGRGEELTQQEHAERIAIHLQKLYDVVNVTREANARNNYTKPINRRDGTTHWRTGRTQTVQITAQKVLEEASKHKLAKGDLKIFQLNYNLPQTTIEDFSVAMEETIGHATEAALDKMLGGIREIQTTMTQATQWMNIVFTKDFARRLAWVEKRDGEVPNTLQRREILNQMIEEGAVPGINTPLTTNIMERLDISKTGQVVLKVNDPSGKLNEDGSPKQNNVRGIAYFKKKIKTSQVVYDEKGNVALNSKEKPRDGMSYSITTSIKGPEPKKDIGVSAIVKAIHASDGAVNSGTFGFFPSINVHDAIITGIQHTLNAAKKSNRTFIETHAGYSIVEAIWDSFVQMAALVDGKNSQLSTQEKREIVEEFYASMVKHADWQGDKKGYSGKPDVIVKFSEKLTAIDDWIKHVQETVANNHAGRAELFPQIRSGSQFAIDGGEFAFENGIQIAPLKSNVTTKVTSQLSLFSELHEELAHKDLFVLIVASIRRNEDPTEKILTYIRGFGTPQNAAEIFNALAAAYAYMESPAAQTLREINSIVGENLEGVQIRSRPIPVTPLTDEQDSARYLAESKMIELDTSLENRSAVQDIAHKIIHAMNYAKLQIMEVKKPAEFKKLQNIAREFLDSLDKSKPTEQAIARAIQFYWTSDKPAFVSQYMAHVLTQSKTLDARYVQYFGEDSLTIKTAIQSLNTALADDSGKTPYRNSGEDLNLDIFEARFAEKMGSDQMQIIFEEMDRLDSGPTNPEEATFLNSFIQNWLVPGMRSIDDLMVNRTTVDAGTMHQGAFVPPTIDSNGNPVIGTVYVAAAGNPTTSQTSMTAKEVFAHELSHAITGAAINGNLKLRNEAQRLFELAKKYITPEHFLRDPATALPADLAAAEARWNYIFNNKDARGYHEFIAMASTNYQLAKILSTVDNKALKTPIADWNLLVMLSNLLNRIVDWISDRTLRKNSKDVHTAVMGLVDNIIKINNQNVAVASQIKEGSFVNKWNDKTVQLIAKKMLKKLQSTKLQEEVLDASRAGEKTNLIKLAGAVVSSATSVNTQQFRDALGEYFRLMHGKKDNVFYQLIEEVLPYQKANLKFLDLLRHSKVVIDMKRQQMIEHTRSFLLNQFDTAVTRTQEGRNAVTQALLMTDLSVLTQGINKLSTKNVVEFLQDKKAATTYMNRQISEVEEILNEQLSPAQATRLLQQFVNVQGLGLAALMVDGTPPVPMQMRNAHNIVNQFYIVDEDKQIPLENKAELIEKLDKIISIQALLRTHPNIITSALSVINHEMTRNPDSPENAIEYLLGTSEDFKQQSRIINFQNNPIFMQKGYISEIYDENIEVKVVPDNLLQNAKMKEEGYTIAEKALARYEGDPNRQIMSMWTRRSTITGYQKSIFSITDIAHGGTDIFTSLEQVRQDPDSDGKISAFQAAANFQVIKKKEGRLAAIQTSFDPLNKKVHMVPVLDDTGVVRNFVYVMSEEHRRVHLKKRSYFDEVLPAMFGRMIDKHFSKQTNRGTIKALHDDFIEYGEYIDHPGDPKHRFLEISKHSKNPKARELYRLMPKDAQEYMRELFGGDHFFIRDDVVNLVLGFRKLSVANNEFLGKAAPLVRLSEKIFQELLQWKRIQIAILNPLVVTGNIVSNILILLTEGIPPSYIMKMGTEALKGIRQYQRDIRTADELEHEVAAARKMGRNVTERVNKLTQLQDNIRRNPVGELIDEGLFTSIVEEFGVDENSWRRQKISGLSEKLGNKVPKKLVGALKEIWMLPGSKAFQAALVGTQYGDFVGRYIKFKYDTEEKKGDGLSSDERNNLKQLEKSIARNLEIRQALIDAQANKIAAAEKLRAEDSRWTVLSPDPDLTKYIDSELKRQSKELKLLVNKRKKFGQKTRAEAINDSLASFIYYDLPQNEYLQYANDMGFLMFTKFFARIQPVIARMFLKNPLSATAYIALQSTISTPPFYENIFNYGALSGATNKFTWNPLEHVFDPEYLKAPSRLWFELLGIGG